MFTAFFSFLLLVLILYIIIIGNFYFFFINVFFYFRGIFMYVAAYATFSERKEKFSYEKLNLVEKKKMKFFPFLFFY